MPAGGKQKILTDSDSATPVRLCYPPLIRTNDRSLDNTWIKQASLPAGCLNCLRREADGKLKD